MPSQIALKRLGWFSISLAIFNALFFSGLLVFLYFQQVDALRSFGAESMISTAFKQTLWDLAPVLMVALFCFLFLIALGLFTLVKSGPEAGIQSF